VKEENCGIVVEPGDFNGLNDAILLLKSDKSIRQKMGINGRKAFEEKYTTGKVAEKYKNIIRELNFK
jgi:rhamnosyl/mannosyltransferase